MSNEDVFDFFCVMVLCFMMVTSLLVQILPEEEIQEPVDEVYYWYNEETLCLWISFDKPFHFETTLTDDDVKELFSLGKGENGGWAKELGGEKK